MRRYARHQSKDSPLYAPYAFLMAHESTHFGPEIRERTRESDERTHRIDERTRESSE
jgi:hypothetical protein